MCDESYCWVWSRKKEARVRYNRQLRSRKSLEEYKGSRGKKEIGRAKRGHGISPAENRKRINVYKGQNCRGKRVGPLKD